MVDRTTSVSRRFTQHTTTASGGDGGENNIPYTAKKRHHAEVSILCLPGPNVPTCKLAKIQSDTEIHCKQSNGRIAPVILRSSTA